MTTINRTLSAKGMRALFLRISDLHGLLLTAGVDFSNPKRERSLASKIPTQGHREDSRASSLGYVIVARDRFSKSRSIGACPLLRADVRTGLRGRSQRSQGAFGPRRSDRPRDRRSRHWTGRLQRRQRSEARIDQRLRARHRWMVLVQRSHAGVLSRSARRHLPGPDPRARPPTLPEPL